MKAIEAYRISAAKADANEVEHLALLNHVRDLIEKAVNEGKFFIANPFPPDPEVSFFNKDHEKPVIDHLIYEGYQIFHAPGGPLTISWNNAR